MKYPTKKTPIFIILISMVSLITGINYNIYILQTLGFMLPSYAGVTLRQSATPKKDKEWSPKKHLLFIFYLILACIALTWIGYGKLW